MVSYGPRIFRERRHHHTKRGRPVSRIAWSDRLSVGIDLIDTQHKSLIQKIADLEDALRRGQGTAEIVRVLGFLAEYVDFHFGTEERNMKGSDYADMAAHVAKHEEFRQTLSNLGEDFEEEGATQDLADSIETLLMHWFASHITDVDQRFGAFVRKSNYTMVA